MAARVPPEEAGTIYGTTSRTRKLENRSSDDDDDDDDRKKGRCPRLTSSTNHRNDALMLTNTTTPRSSGWDAVAQATKPERDAEQPQASGSPGEPPKPAAPTPGGEFVAVRPSAIRDIFARNLYLRVDPGRGVFSGRRSAPSFATRSTEKRKCRNVSWRVCLLV